MRRAITYLVAAALILVVRASNAPAADAAGPIPGLPWVHEGTIVTARWYTANLFATAFTMTPDENGNWRGADGKLYSGHEHQNMDAGGYNQTTVVAIDGDQVLLKTIKFTNVLSDPIRATPDKGGEVRFIAKATQNTFCMAPDLLAKEAADLNTGKLVHQVKWPRGDKMVDAIRIDKLSQNERIAIVYDRNTGLGLHLSSVSSTGADSGSILMEYDTVGVRDLQVPWVAEGIPQAMKNFKSLRLAGRMVQEAAFGMRPTTLSIDFTADSCSDKWACVSSVGTAQLPGIPRPMSSPAKKLYYGPGEFGGLFVGPAAAAKLHQDQVLDEDPVTKMRTFVSNMDNRTVTITQSNRSTTVKCDYDLSTGLMVGNEWFDTMTKFHTTMTRENP